MSKRRKPKRGQRTQVGSVMARAAWEAKVAAMRNGNRGPRAWTQDNGRARANKAACRGSWS